MNCVAGTSLVLSHLIVNKKMMIGEDVVDIDKLSSTFADKLAPNEAIDVEKWAPAGEPLDELQTVQIDERIRFRELEEEQERLNSSLLSLSTHFAQVQFRLKQISRAEASERDRLLKELEDFAFRGCSDLGLEKRRRSPQMDNDKKIDVNQQKERQKILIAHLKQQLEDLEKYAYESGEGDLPSAEVMARQKAVIDKLHEKVQLDLELDRMSQSDLQKKVDEALKKLVNPIKAKEQLVEQLQAQIVDLERFIGFLQTETGERLPNSIASLPVVPTKKSSFMSLIRFNQKFERNQLKQTPQGSHYGQNDEVVDRSDNFSDERARIELAVDATIQVMEKYLLLSVDTDMFHTDSSDKSYDEIFKCSEEEVVTVIRKQLCPAMRDLLEHGMNTVVKHFVNFTSLGCYPRSSRATKNNSARKLEHIWDVVMYYYDSKFGREYCDAPIRRLSQSYQLDVVAGRSVTSKQLLLSTIENITSTHSRLKRSSDAMWKALVSAALNEKKLPTWIRTIFCTEQIVEQCFAPWSYVARTGCEDTYQLLEHLHKYNFHLPVDLAVRPFHQMKDAF
uniref:RUN domain-containing protein n=1 Tax=Onchocerca volvulus TaxID=6282 RepID=A0A8R1XXU7_ONCVO